MKEELDLEEKTDVEPVGVPTEEAAGSPGAEEAVTGGMSGEEKEYLEEYLRQLRELQAAAG